MEIIADYINKANHRCLTFKPIKVAEKEYDKLSLCYDLTAKCWKGSAHDKEGWFVLCRTMAANEARKHNLQKVLDDYLKQQQQRQNSKKYQRSKFYGEDLLI